MKNLEKAWYRNTGYSFHYNYFRIEIAPNFHTRRFEGIELEYRYNFFNLPNTGLIPATTKE
jgi:hypothetical protein